MPFFAIAPCVDAEMNNSIKELNCACAAFNVYLKDELPFDNRYFLPNGENTDCCFYRH